MSADVVFEPACTSAPGIVMCGPGGVVIRQRGKCFGLCAGDNARLAVRHPSSPWYGLDVDCECGDSWSEGELRQRPFARAWRKKAVARFEKAWEKALPEGTVALRRQGGDGDGYLTGVRLPDGTVVNR